MNSTESPSSPAIESPSAIIPSSTESEAHEWFAIRTRLDFRAAHALKPLCDEVYFPTETVRRPNGRDRLRAIIPHVMFVRTTAPTLLALEQQARTAAAAALPCPVPPFWIYRYPNERQVRSIPPSTIALLRLLTADDDTRCQVFNPQSFRPGQHVLITGGFFEGRTGYVQRVKKNRHVIVKIEGICLILLPFIHPDLLRPID